MLVPGGRIVLWLPLDDWRTQRGHQAPDRNHHLYAWTPLLLHNLLVEAGFEVLELRPVAYAFPPMLEKTIRVLPRAAFDLLARTVAVTRRRRQLMAVGRRPA